MASNSFGKIFRWTTFGESHGKAIGVVIDGCPAGLEISDELINEALKLRAPGQSPLTSPRKEKDAAEIVSGIFEGKTTGAPIAILIWNKDADSSKYEPIKGLLRPGHANFTYLEKYGIFDYRGGGRSSARETAARVAAGAVAKQLLSHFGIKVRSFLKQVGPVKDLNDENLKAVIEAAKEEGDSLGGIVEFEATGLPVGLGDPVYEKLEANLAKAMMSLPATKGFEIGEGFHAAEMKGSEHNDAFESEGEKIKTSSSHAGGTLGGISNGMPLVGRVAFKPTSSIKKAQETTTIEGEKAEFKLPEGSRHDPCVAIRAVPIVEAMVYLVLADAILLNRSAKL
ncbi:MAG: chorismate synthase [Chlamydiia bacterium]|nr:chorismate synthase [Chlamydiia bacterium]